MSQRKSVTQGAVFLSVLFVLVVAVLSLIQGLTEFAFFVVALALLLLLGTTITLIRWVQQGGVVDAADQVSTVVYVQAFAMVVLGAAMLVNMYSAPNCPKPNPNPNPDPEPAGCLFSYTHMPPGGIATTEPQDNTRPLCFRAPDCMEEGQGNDTVCVWPTKGKQNFNLGTQLSGDFQDMMNALDEEA
jgi:hypothetical protein